MARKRIKDKEKNKKRSFGRPGPSFHSRRKVLSSRVVFGDIDESSEINLDMERSQHGISRGGRGRSL